MLFSPTCRGPLLKIACRSTSTFRSVRRRTFAACALPLKRRGWGEGSQSEKQTRDVEIILNKTSLLPCRRPILECPKTALDTNNARQRRSPQPPSTWKFGAGDSETFRSLPAALRPCRFSLSERLRLPKKRLLFTFFTTTSRSSYDPTAIQQNRRQLRIYSFPLKREPGFPVHPAPSSLFFLAWQQESPPRHNPPCLLQKAPLAPLAEVSRCKHPSARASPPPPHSLPTLYLANSLFALACSEFMASCSSFLEGCLR